MKPFRKQSRSTSSCLRQDEIAALLGGDLSQHAAAEMADHFSTCETCRVRVQAAIGSDAWWDDASKWLGEESFRDHRDESPTAWESLDSQKPLPALGDCSVLREFSADDGWPDHFSDHFSGQWPDSGDCADLNRPGTIAGQGSGRSVAGDIGDVDPADPSPTDDPVIAELLDLLGPTEFPEMLGRIGHYEIAGVLGYGGMGGVFKGFDRSLHRFVAIKMMLPHLAVSAVGRERFAREAKAIAAVVDDHVMAIHSVDQWKSVPYFVMPLVRGESLRTRLDEHGPMGIREVLRISMQAARGLAASHAQGIIHRDVKPANIFLDGETDRAQLVDFGIAVISDDPSLTMTGNLTGTPQFMSPEQARGEPVTASSDLFSLGAVIHSMCTGQPPFHAETAYGVLRLITDKPVRPMRHSHPDVPTWLDDIVQKLMAKQPQDRFASATVVADLLQGCLAHIQQPTSVPLPVALEALRPHDQRLIDRTQVRSSRLIAMLVSLMLCVWVTAAIVHSIGGPTRPTDPVAMPHRIVISGNDQLTVAQLWDRWKEMPIGSTQEARAQQHLIQVFLEETSVSSSQEYLERRRQWATEILPLVTSGVAPPKAQFLIHFLRPLDPKSLTAPPTSGLIGSFAIFSRHGMGQVDEPGAFQTAQWDIQTTLAMTMGRIGRHTDAQSIIDILLDDINESIDRFGGSKEVHYLGHRHAIRSVLGWCQFYQASIRNMTVETMEAHLEDKPENESPNS